MQMRPFERKSRQEYVIEQIQEFILNNVLKPNDSLPSEQELANTLNVSRSTIREALRKLETIGLIDVSHGERPKVSSLSLERFLDALKMFMIVDKNEFLDLMEFRKILELGALEIAINKLTKENVKNLEKYIELMEENIDNPAIFALNDHKFHLEIIRATENLLLSKFMDIVSSALLKVQNITSRFPSSKIAIPQHKEILDAIIHKDIIRAQGILAQHINTTEKKLIEYFNLREGNSILT